MARTERTSHAEVVHSSNVCGIDRHFGPPGTWGCSTEYQVCAYRTIGFFLFVAGLAATLKIKLPGLPGTMSVNLPFILLAAAEMSLAEAVVVGCISTLVQCLPRGKQKFNPIQAAFSCSTIMLAVTATKWIFVSP